MSFMPNINSNKNTDSYKDIWAAEFPEIPIDEGSVKFLIEDEQSKINISALANVFVENTPYYGILQRLLGDMGLILDIADYILYWVDPDPARSLYGNYYLSLKPPYKAQNSEMGSIDELLLVKLVTPEIYYGLGGGNYGLEKDLVEDNKDNIKLTDELFSSLEGDQGSNFQNSIERKIGREKDRALYNYLRVHGNPNDFTDEANRININTASFRVLMALSDETQEGVVTEIIRRRQSEPFKHTTEINEFIREPDKLRNLITVRSSIFKITVTATGSDKSGFCRFITYYDRNRNKVLYSSIEH
jgi:type II secretory pathway component PulK